MRAGKSPSASTTRLRHDIISAYQRAQRLIITAAGSPTTNPHAAMAAYDKIYRHLRADIIRASDLFPDADAP